MDHTILQQLVKQELLNKVSDLEKQISLLDEHHNPAGGRSIHNTLHQKKEMMSHIENCFCQCGNLHPKIIKYISNYVKKCHTNHYDEPCYNCMVQGFIEHNYNIISNRCTCEAPGLVPPSKNRNSKDGQVPPLFHVYKATKK